MSRSSIYNSIRHYENQIDSYQYQIQKLKNKLSKLQTLHQKYSNLQNDFGSKQSLRKNKLSNVSCNTVHVKMVSPYYNGMSDLLSGSSFNHAYNGLNEAKSRISSTMNSTQNQIESLCNSVSYCERRIDDLYNELSEMEN